MHGTDCLATDLENPAVQFKRLLFFTHRWLGVGFALFMLLWFVSGLVIIYAPNTIQNRDDRLARAEPLGALAPALSVGEAWTRYRAAQAQAAPAEITSARLVRQLGEVLWLIEDTRGQRIALSATDGRPREADAARAIALSRAWLGDGSAAITYLETFTRDATVRNQDAFSPFHRVAVADGHGTELTISARTGEVVRDATAIDRGLFWLGNWLHLFRPLESLGWSEARRDVLLWVSGLTVVAALTGLIVGWLRWRPGFGAKPQYSGGRAHPYRAFWLTWHFWSGLFGGVAAFLWIFSAFFNNNPWQLFSPANADRAEQNRFLGGTVPPGLLEWRPALPAHLAASAVELRWQRLGDEAVLFAADREGRLQALPTAAVRFSESALLAAVERAAPGVQIARYAELTEYDNYYYPRNGRGTSDRPLPAIRVELADASHTRYYLDPREGRLLLKQDDSRRVYRWLFSALHHWDIGWLHARPLWDGWMLLWIGFGLVMSLSALVLGWKRLALTFRSRRGAAKPATARPAAGTPAAELATESASS